MEKELFDHMMQRTDIQIRCGLDAMGNTVWTFLHKEWTLELYTEA